MSPLVKAVAFREFHSLATHGDPWKRMQLVGSDGADSPKIMDMLHMLVSLQDAVVVGSLYTVCVPKLPAKNNLTFTSSCAISTSTRILFLVSNPYLDYVFLNPKNPQKIPQKLSIKIQKSSKLSILDPTFGTFGSVQGEKFAFWPDGGCLIAGTDSQRVIAEDYEVISGRRAP